MASQSKFVAIALIAISGIPSLAQDAEFVPETLSVKETIDPGPNVFLNEQSWDGAGAINVYSADDLTFKGLMSAGSMGQILIAPDGMTAYSQSTFLSRISYGDAEHVLQVYDVATLTPVKEVILPPKAAMAVAYPHLLEQSADGKFIYVQNATPATSITVVEIESGTVVQEIPAPGCYGIYPSLEGYSFSSICGDGTFASFTLSEDGASSEKTQSAVLFDPDADPLFLASERVGENLAFLSYGGTVHLLSDAEGTVSEVESFSITEGTEGEWAPGGYGHLTYNDTHGVLFVGMHPEAYDGSHKNAAEEIWAYNVAGQELLYQSPVEGIISIAVTDGAEPVLFGINEHEASVVRYAIDPDAKFALKKTAETGDTGFSTVVAVMQ